jgi:uncharacterized membrane protein
MHKVQKSVDINAPAERIYEFLGQPANLPEIWPNLISTSKITQGVGGACDFDWLFKMAGIQIHGHAKCEEGVPGKYVRYRNTGIPGTFVFRYSALDGHGTRLQLTVDYDFPSSVLGRIAEVLAVKINERDIDSMLMNVKDVMEYGVPGLSARERASY